MRAAFELGVPFTEFMGRPLQDGPRWTSDDRDVAVAWLAYSDSLCPCCGVPKDEAWSPDAEGAWVGEVLHCHVGAAMDRARGAFMRQAGPDTDVDTAGLKTIARRREEGTDG